MNRTSVPVLLALSLILLASLPSAAFAAATAEPAANRLYVHVEGMQSEHCELFLVDTVMTRLEDVQDMEADHESGWVWIEIDPGADAEQRIRGAIEEGCSFKVTEVRHDPPPATAEEEAPKPSGSDATDG